MIDDTRSLRCVVPAKAPEDSEALPVRVRGPRVPVPFSVQAEAVEAEVVDGDDA